MRHTDTPGATVLLILSERDLTPIICYDRVWPGRDKRGCNLQRWTGESSRLVAAQYGSGVVRAYIMLAV